MYAGELFLNCNNLTQDQYETIVLSRALTGAGGCSVTLAILVIVLLTTKRKALENLTKRVYLVNIIYTTVYCIIAIAAFHYSDPSSQESGWCEAMGFLLQYSGTLVVFHYRALTTTIMLKVTITVYQTVLRRTCNVEQTKLREAILFVILFFCPVVITWEPFLPNLYVPMVIMGHCASWFHLELSDKRTLQLIQ